MRDYSQAKIYTIRNNKIVLVYMLVQLLNHCHNDWQNINMIANDILKLYENYPCKNKAQLMKRENEIINKIGNLNSIDIGETLRVKKKYFFIKG